MSPGPPPPLLPVPTQTSRQVKSTLHRLSTLYPSSFSLFAFWFSLSLLTLLPACSRTPDPGIPIPNPRILGGLGDTPGRYGYPRCIEADPLTSTLWVIDRTARVQRIDPQTGRCLGFFHTPESNLGKPCGLDIAPGLDEHDHWTDSLLYIADTHYHRVLIYHPPAPVTDERKREIAPPIVASIGTYGRDPGQFIYPTDVAVLLTPDGRRVDRLYVSEYGGNDRISVFEAGPTSHDFTFKFSFGAMGNSADPAKIEFNRPQSLAIDHTKSPPRLIVTDSCNHRIGVFALDGRLIRWLGTPDAPSLNEIPPQPNTIDIPATPAAGTGHRIAVVGQPVKLLYPYGLRLLPDGTALISEFGAARMQQVDLDTGNCLASWGRPGRDPGELAAPWALTTLASTVYLLDSGNNRIQAFPTPPPRN